MKLINQFDFSSMKKDLNTAIWRYTDPKHSSGGLHISVSAESKARLASLLDFIAESDSIKNITIDLINVSNDILEVPNFGCNVKSFNKVKFYRSEACQKIYVNGNDIIFELSKESISKISNCVKSILSGYEKNIILEGEVINFWWQLLR
jgi:hypothetical protein